MVSRQFNYSKNPRMSYIVEEHINVLGKLGVTVRSSFQSSINGSDKTHICESLRLNHIRWIGDGPSRSPRIARVEVTSETPSADLDITLQMCFISFNLSRYNSLDERMRLNQFSNNSPMKHNPPCIPPPPDLSEDRWHLFHT